MKYVIKGTKVIDAHSTAASFSQEIINNAQGSSDVSFIDNIGLQFIWTGTTSGTITVACSIDGENFDNLTFDPEITQPSGSAGHSSANINQFPFKFYKVTYTRTSGTGTLTVWLSGKAI